MTIVVTYPDGSTEEVTATIHVNYDNENNEPAGQNITVDKNVTPDPAAAISNKNDLPESTIMPSKSPLIPVCLVIEATIVVTYPDESTDEVVINIHITSDAEKNTPTTQRITVEKDATPIAAISLEQIRLAHRHDL